MCPGVLSVLSAVSPGVAISLLWCSGVLSVLSAVSPDVAIGPLSVLVSCLFSLLSVQASPLVLYLSWCLVCSLCCQSRRCHWSNMTFWCLVCSLSYQSRHHHWSIMMFWCLVCSLSCQSRRAISLLWCSGVLSVLSSISPGAPIGLLCVLVSYLFSPSSVLVSYWSILCRDAPLCALCRVSLCPCAISYHLSCYSFCSLYRCSLYCLPDVHTVSSLACALMLSVLLLLLRFPAISVGFTILVRFCECDRFLIQP